MNRRLLIAIAVVVLCVGLVIVTGIILQRVGGRPVFLTFGVGVALIGVWIYLVWMLRKKKAKIFPDQMEPKLAERRLKWLKTSLLVGGISLAVGIVGTVVHNLLYIPLGEVEEPISFFIAIVGLFVFVIATAGGWIMFFIGRQKTT